MICNDVINIFCEGLLLGKSLYQHGGTFRNWFSSSLQKAKLDKLISLENNNENNDGNKSQRQYFYTRSQVGVSQKLIEKEIVSFVEKYCMRH